MKYLVSLIAISFSFSVLAQNSYSISGSFKSLDSIQEVVLSTFDPILQERKPVAKSFVHISGEYALNFEFEHPESVSYRLS